jgi:predicted nuclease of predicted toxin-antitoxin system
MIIWVDAQLPPVIAAWITEHFGIQAVAVRDLGLRDATDRQIFLSAQQAQVVVMTKDSDFLWLLDELGAPPGVIWITCGNTSNARPKAILASTLTSAVTLPNVGVTKLPYISLAAEGRTTNTNTGTLLMTEVTAHTPGGSWSPWCYDTAIQQRLMFASTLSTCYYSSNTHQTWSVGYVR